MDLGDSKIAHAYAETLANLGAGQATLLPPLAEGVALIRPLDVFPAGPGG